MDYGYHFTGIEKEIANNGRELRSITDALLRQNDILKQMLKAKENKETAEYVKAVAKDGGIGVEVSCSFKFAYALICNLIEEFGESSGLGTETMIDIIYQHFGLNGDDDE